MVRIRVIVRELRENRALIKTLSGKSTINLLIIG